MQEFHKELPHLTPIVISYLYQQLIRKLIVNVKLFVNDAALFSVTHDVNLSAMELMIILEKSAIGVLHGKGVSI